MTMKIINKALLAASTLLISSQVMAIPRLQLDISSTSTYYDSADETIMTLDPQFTLRTFLNDTDPTGDFFLSIAISPKQLENTNPDIGSFTVGANSYSIADMIWGTPPADFEELSSHGVFDTYYIELAVSFDTANTVATYNTEDGTSGSGSMMFNDFSFNVNGLLEGYQLHFDLYEFDTTAKKVVVDKAPFSHDAGTNVSIPEPATLALLGLGLLSIGAAQTTRRQERYLK